MVVSCRNVKFLHFVLTEGICIFFKEIPFNFSDAVFQLWSFFFVEFVDEPYIVLSYTDLV
jgi:hypothetical protein